jgi:hypothetical protein
MKHLLLLFLLCLTLNVESQVLRGKVHDSNGEGIPFAKVHLKNSSYGTFANSFGKFQIELKQGTHTLEFSASGFHKNEKTVTIPKGGQTDFSIQLDSEVQELDEVIISYRSERDRGKEIMKEVIDKRSYFQGFLNEYSADSYCFTSLEKDHVEDITDSVVGKEKLNLMEWRAVSHYKKSNRYKDEFYAYQDFMETKSELNSTSVGISIKWFKENKWVSSPTE